MAKKFSFSLNSTIHILFFASCLIWIYLFRGFLLNDLRLVQDAVGYYENTYYYFLNLKQGIFPLWDPTRDIGVPNELFLRRIGEFNPFYIPFFVLYCMGVSFPTCYFAFLALYFFLGIWGFYKLAQILLKDNLTAFSAMTLLMFSAFGTLLFRSFLILLFVPIVWFFYFLLRFNHQVLEKPRDFTARYAFMGMVFCIMIIVTTYIPFYFLNILLTVCVLGCLIYFDEIQKIFLRYKKFISENKLLVAAGMGLIILSLMPGISFFKEAGQGMLVFPDRQYPIVSPNSLTVPEQSVAVGGISPPSILENAGQREFELGAWYVPVFTYVLLALGLFVKIDRMILFLTLSGFINYLISVYDASGVYPFLYEHIFYFKYFRNFQFFLWLCLLPVLILLAAYHLKLLIDCLSVSKKKSYSKNLRMICFLLWLVIIIHPVNYFSHISQKISKRLGIYHYEETPWNLRLKNKSETAEESNVKPMPLPYVALKWSFDFYSAVSSETADRYMWNTFLIYDRLELISESAIDMQRIEKSLKARENVAFVSDPDALKELNVKDDSAEIVYDHSPSLSVIDSNVNHIQLRTNFDRERFLVYNDSYHPDWHVFIDGVQEKIYRTNVAFKGIWVPEGIHHIEFRFGNPLKYVLNFALIGLFASTALFLLCNLKTGLKEE